MKFVIDDKIPFIRGVLEPFADVSYIAGAKIRRMDLIDADGIIIRTRTRCDASLLEGTGVKFIATATIGFDHIDTDYCRQAGIQWSNAPGCNSESVNQYIASALTYWSAERKVSLSGKTIGIIGVGNVGSKVARTAEILGLNVLLNDPPRAREEGPEGFVEMKQILEEADIISLHVPLNMDGRDKTFHLLDDKFIKNWKNPDLLINTCRGEVTETGAVLKGLEQNIISDTIIDCWENEPDISINLLENSFIGTPHIAGYSRDGKANGTAQCIRAVSKYFKLGLDNWFPGKIESPHFPTIYIDGAKMSEREILHSAIQSSYAVSHDDAALRNDVKSFEKLRGDYPIRREFNAFDIIGINIHQDTIIKLRELGFKPR